MPPYSRRRLNVVLLVSWGPSVARPERPKLEAARAESGNRVLGGDSEPPHHQLGGLGERCKLPQWGLCEARAAKSFDAFCVLRRPLLLWKIVCALCKCVISLNFVTHVRLVIALKLGLLFSCLLFVSSAWGRRELGAPVH